jgi:hypothetical protein
MKIIKSDSTLNLATQVALPSTIIKGLFIRFAGTNAAGQTATEANLGSIRVNYRGQDIVNADIAFFGLLNNLTKGVHEFSSAIGGDVVASYYIPFNVPWDEQNGLINTEADRGTVYLQFPALIAALVATGSVEIYVIEAKTVATYVPVWLNQNLQAGGAGQLTDRFRQFNISSVYYVENAAITGQVIVNKDGQNVINASQAVLKANSNLINNVETAVTLIQIDLNPNHILGNALANNVDVVIGVNAGTTIVAYVLAILYQQAATGGQVTTFSPVQVGTVQTVTPIGAGNVGGVNLQTLVGGR